jgi:hypothetical protein
MLVSGEAADCLRLPWDRSVGLANEHVLLGRSERLSCHDAVGKTIAQGIDAAVSAGAPPVHRDLLVQLALVDRIDQRVERRARRKFSGQCRCLGTS